MGDFPCGLFLCPFLGAVDRIIGLKLCCMEIVFCPFRSDDSEGRKEQKMTLQELQGKVDSTVGKKRPTAAKLKEGSSPVVASVETTDGRCRLTVYQNGFALYETDGRRTVLEVSYYGGYTYPFSLGKNYVSEQYFLETEWWVRLALAGEERIARNWADRIAHNEFTCGSASDVLGSVLAEEESPEERCLRRDRVRTLLSLLSEHQMEVVLLYYAVGLTLAEIADIYGISYQAVHDTLRSVKKKIAKNLNAFD